VGWRRVVPQALCCAAAVAQGYFHVHILSLAPCGRGHGHDHVPGGDGGDGNAASQAIIVEDLPPGDWGGSMVVDAVWRGVAYSHQK